MPCWSLPLKEILGSTDQMEVLETTGDLEVVVVVVGEVAEAVRGTGIIPFDIIL